MNIKQLLRGDPACMPGHPFAGASWTQVVDGVFQLNEDYYRKSGGILTPSKHYDDMFAHHRG
ncbi:MAG: hypothetical protein IIA65_03535 [Planctomycetes bacterium]|nr:hypothetical protein [Planctomycetota bacterium]